MVSGLHYFSSRNIPNDIIHIVSYFYPNGIFVAPNEFDLGSVIFGERDEAMLKKCLSHWKSKMIGDPSVEGLLTT